MLRRTKKTFSPAEYLAMEEVAECKSAHFNGEIFSMSGGTPDHSSIAVNVITKLSQLLASRPCRVFNSDRRLHIEPNGLYTYPDVMVICGKIELVKRRNDTVTNPILIVEVLSESIRDYDRGMKFNLYKQVPTLQKYVVIESENPRVEYYRHSADDQWVVEMIDDPSATVRLASVACEIALREIYHKVSWE